MSEKKKFIPLSVPNLCGREWQFVKKCLDSGWLSTAGSFVEKFEKKVIDYTGSKYAIACVNGTAGLQVALRLCGVTSGDEVIVPTLTFIAPINAVRYQNAEPVFMDCDDFMNIDTEKIEDFCKKECTMNVKGLINKSTGKQIKAIIPVHIFGNLCNMENIMKVAEKFDLKVIEDATEAIGSYFTKGKYKGKMAGSIGNIGVYSFNGNKIITTGGGGMILTQDKIVAEKTKYFTTQAKDDEVRYIHHEIGYNYRLSNINAAIGIAQLEQLEKFISIKKKNYELYKKELKNTEGINLLDAPRGMRINYWFYSLLVDEKKYRLDNESLMVRLNKKGIQTRPLWYLNHLQKPYLKNQAFKIEKAPYFLKTVLNLPCSSNLKTSEIKRIVSELRGIKNAQR